jgi:endonuclease/exonuclease/phosphatase (EEP) superfamily protein YafD
MIDSAQGHGVQPTWPNFNPLLWIPLDHVLHSTCLAVRDRIIGPDVGSDHYPVIVDFSLRQGP